MSSAWNSSGLCKMVHHNTVLCIIYLSLVGWKLYKQVNPWKGNCEVGTKIPRLKSHGFCYLGIFEIASLFCESNRSGTSKAMNLRWISPDMFSSTQKKPVFPFTNLFWYWWDAFWAIYLTVATNKSCFFYDVTIHTNKCSFSCDACPCSL
jgi:hypothetical protein